MVRDRNRGGLAPAISSNKSMRPIQDNHPFSLVGLVEHVVLPSLAQLPSLGSIVSLYLLASVARLVSLPS